MTFPEMKTKLRKEGRLVPDAVTRKIRGNHFGLARFHTLRGHWWSQRTLLNGLTALLVAVTVSLLFWGLDAIGNALVAGIGIVAFALLLMQGSLRPPSPARQRGPLALPAVPLESVLEGLAAISEARDTEMRGHCLRVAANSVSVGTAMGLSDADVQTLYWGGLLHDLGKLVVAASTLEKADRLTEAELAEIRRHPAYGADLVAAVAPDTSIARIAEAIRYHHERWDGLGYPSGLKREEIPLSARIVAVVDVFEALTSDRPYRQPLRPDQALVYVRRCSGTHFDPEVVAAFERLYYAGALRIADEAQVPEASTLPAAQWATGFSGAEQQGA